jgi:phenylacetate-CoA ligase
VPYYRAALSDAGWTPPERLTLEEWQRLPVLKRAEVQQAGDQLNSRVVPADHGRSYPVRSSGSTGRPVSVNKTALCHVFWRVFTLRDHLWHRRRLDGKLAVIRYSQSPRTAPPHGIQRDGWGNSTDHLYQTGPAALLRSSTDIATQADWLRRQDPDYLLTYPSNLDALARYFSQQRWALPRLREVRTLGETLSPEVRQACHDAWGVKLVDMYSAEETGYLALQCPEHEHYHVQSEGVLVEVLDDRNRSCSPGEIGRVVVSPLHNYATPLLRYELGDYAEVGEACPCGRGLPVLNRILGRTRNMLRLPDGRVCWPKLSTSKYESVVPLRQVQVVQHSLEHVELRLVASESASPDQEEQLAAIVQESLGHPFRITVTYLDEIPRSPRDKFEDFLCLIDDA